MFNFFSRWRFQVHMGRENPSIKATTYYFTRYTQNTNYEYFLKVSKVNKRLWKVTGVFQRRHKGVLTVVIYLLNIILLGGKNVIVSDIVNIFKVHWKKSLNFIT